MRRKEGIAKLEENWSLSEVAAELNENSDYKGKGIGKVSTENEDNDLFEFISHSHNPIETAVKAQEETLFPGSLRITQRRLKQCGFKNCVAAHKVFLTEEHKQRRVQFANEFLQGNEFWNNVVFSDEKTLQSSKNGRLRVFDPGIQDLKRITPCILPIVAAFRPANRDQLWESIENAWKELVDSYDMRTLIASMPRRLENIVASNGYAITY
ncbi:hypothetical protein NQ318_011164 [Aromia moschata]|uniref:Transposase Tc1-like domain-containing protein n=1 Tax=Aromia moschata TaxID=1265417 RepID=A0AAV8YJ30_9CUCU|nr:hypothetical protein NQ318_011164 [Aromia moschata]